MRARPTEPVTHQFKVGQTVFYRPITWLHDAPKGAFEIIARLPQRTDGEFEYRIRHSAEQYARVARESELKRS
jgi:hypothetical protein